MRPDPRDQRASAEPHLGQITDPIDSADGDDLEDEPIRASEVEPETVEHSIADEVALASAGLVPDHIIGFARDARVKREQTSGTLRVLVMLGLVILSGPAAVLAALGQGIFDGPTGSSAWYAVVIAPPVEEMLKVALLLWVAERKPWLLSSAGILLTGIASGLAFGAIENLMYLAADGGRTPWLAGWRWGFTMPLHAACSLIAAFGIMRAWQRTWTSGQRLETANIVFFLVAAILVHACNNAIATLVSIGTTF